MVFCKFYHSETDEKSGLDVPEGIWCPKNESVSQMYLITQGTIFTFSSYEKVLVLCEKSLSEFPSNLYVMISPESEKMVFTEVSVCSSRSYTQ